jgi:hypothetical protein
LITEVTVAVMHPRRPSPATQSGAELQLFPKLRDELPDDVHVIHSLGMARHPTKPWAEIDFVVIAGEGVFCLEVKGGRIKRAGAVWYTGDHKLKESPFQQAGSASTALYRELAPEFEYVPRSIVGWGVLFPDVEFNEQGPTIELEVLYDANDTAASFSAYLDRIAAYWRRRLHPKGSFRPLARAERSQLVHRLAGDFDLMPCLRSDVMAVEAELVRLTAEQVSAVEGLQDNDRVLIQGAAGTGKTMIAVSEARRLASSGQQVLLTCFNRRLASFLRDELSDVPNVSAVHLHAFMKEVVDSAGLSDRLPDAESADLLRQFYPELATEALLEHGGRFDALIVDELQDLQSDPYLDVFDSALRLGLEGGTWRFFFDPVQSLFNSADPEALGRIRGTRHAEFRLQKNCRNTVPIALQGSLLTGLDRQETLEVEGPEVELRWYSDQAEARRAASELIREWLANAVSPEEIVVLSPVTLRNSILAEGLEESTGLRLIEGADSTGDAIGYHTVSSFKGLDRAAVLLVDVDDLLDQRQRASVYVGASRARAVLGVILPESARESYEQRARDFGERVALTEPG